MSELKDLQKQAEMAASAAREAFETFSHAQLDNLFLQARSHNGWLDKPVDDAEIIQLYDLLKMAPTSFNCSSARFLFLRSAEAKEKLKPVLMPGNIEKSMTAPVIAIIGMDTAFHEKLPQLFPHSDVKTLFDKSDELREMTAFRNGSLQGAYLMLAARAIGLDCGPMSGFDNAKLDAIFFSATKVKSNFLCALGHGDPSKLYPRSPRFQFDEACQIL